MAKLTILGVEKEYANGTLFEDIVNEYQGIYKGEIALIKENGKIKGN